MPTNQSSLDAVIVGAGFAGMYMLHRLREMGLSVRVYEAAEDVGGTWYWNRYPGARCDIESMDYSYQFSAELQQEWNWSERYAPQAEILAYANHVADRFELRSDIQFNCRVQAASFDEVAGCWSVALANGETVDAQYCIFATGCLSVPSKPDIAGQDSFKGRVLYTSQWPHQGVDFSGRRVAVIGTGSSAIQSIPLIATEAEQLTVFQRSPNYSVPARNAPLEAGVRDAIKANYAEYRERTQALGHTFGARFPGSESPASEMSGEEQQRQLEIYWQIGGLFLTRCFGDFMTDPATNAMAQEFIRNKIREQVDDPVVAELLCPGSTVACKRLCADTGYFQTYNQDHVELVDIRANPIEAITTTGVRTGLGEYSVDDIIFATGFDAMTGALNAIDIVGREGQLLRDKWQAGPRTLLGVQTAGFPNLFMITGPASPSVLSNMLQSIEQHVEWIADYLVWMRAGDYSVSNASPEAEDQWMEHVAEIADETLYNSCTSWYRGANIEGKAEVFMVCLDYPAYVEHCREVVESGYAGFELS